MIVLLKYIYGESGTGQIINGYSLNQMIWYLIISECLVNSAKCSQISKTITNEIKTGSIAYKLNKPYNYYFYSISSFMAKSCFMILFTVPTAVLMGLIFVGLPASFTIAQILPCLLVFLFATFLSWCFYGAVGILAFWVQDATPFHWIFSKLFMLFGMFFPIEFFPKGIQPIIRYSPVYSIMSGPSSLVANFSWNAFFEIIISQVIWCIIIIFIGLLIFNLGKRKVTSNGG